MPTSAITLPTIDPASIFELFLGSYGSELLTAAVCHFNVFERLANGPLSWTQLCNDLQLVPRSAHVLITALRAFDLLTNNADGATPACDRVNYISGGKWLKFACAPASRCECGSS